MADQSEETMEDEEMARQSQGLEQTSMAVVENIQPLQETRDLLRAENTPMLQADQASKGVCAKVQSLSLQRIEGSGNVPVINPSHCTINILQVKQGTSGSEQESNPLNIPERDDSKAAASGHGGRSLQIQTPDDGSVQGAQVAAESCKEALRTEYKNTCSSVKLIPWDDDDTKHIKDIFTELTLEKSGRKLETYKDIFLQTTRDGDSIKRVILYGLPGRGKSTIMDKMAYDWACGKALQQFELVFLLRMSAVEQSTELIDSIFEQLLAEDTKIDKGALGAFIRDNEDKVLILLDGFDELMTPDLDKVLFGSILKILNRKKGRDCCVVVTTRTSHYHKLVTKSLVQESFTQVRVEGFDKEDIQKYVKKFFSEEHKAKRLIQRIKASNVLSDLAKSPMLLLLLCILWRDESTLPETMSRIYSEALEYIFHRKNYNSPDEKLKVTNELGKIGLHGLLSPEQQLTFPEEVFEPGVLESAMKAGILTRQKVLKGIRSHNSFQFLHKTFQGFCAGKYLQSLLQTDPVEFKKNLQLMINSGGNDFEYVLRFCAGDNMACTCSILQTVAESDQFKEEEEGQDEYKRLLQLGLNCYFEGQSKDLPPVKFIQSVLIDQVVIDDWDIDSLILFTYFLRNVHSHTMANNKTDYLDKVQSVEINLAGCMSDLIHCLSLMVNLSSVTLCGCILNDISEKSAALSGVTSYPVSAASWAQHFKKMKNLQKLHLINCSLTKKDMTHIAPALCDLANLVELNLDWNEDLGGSAASWAHHFKKMKNFQKLHLKGCSLTGEDLTNIAPALCDLPNLNELNLGGNKSLGGSAASWVHHFKKIKNFQKLHLNGCSMTGEDLTHIASALCDLPNLSELNLEGNKSLGGSAASWAHHFKKMENLQNLDMSECSMTGDDMTHIAPALCDLPNLVELNLGGNYILGGSAPSWAHHFKKMQKLQKLDFSNCSLTGEDMTHIAPALFDLPNFVELNLWGNNALGGSAALWVHHFKKMEILQKLNLSYCPFTGEDMTHIAHALCDLPNLVELNLWGNDALGGSAASWAHHFEKMNNLQNLNLSCCSFTGEDLKHIVPALCNLPNFKKFILWRNCALGGSAASWAYHFKNMKNLLKLDLSYCSLTGEDLTHIAPALCDLPNFVKLNLWGNDALGGSAASWVHHFKKMNSLQELNLSYCSLTGTDMTHIAPTLCDLPNLIEMNLWGNDALGGSAATWAHHFKKMNNLQKLNLSFCPYR